MKALASLKVRTRVDFGADVWFISYICEMPLYRNLIQNHLSSMILSVYRFFAYFIQLVLFTTGANTCDAQQKAFMLSKIQIFLHGLDM